MDEIRPLVTQAVDIAFTRGVIMRGNNDHIDHARFTLWPSSFPKTHYDSLLQTQTDFNLLLDKMSQNKSFLLDALQQ